jgi:putative hemolysin
MVGRMVRRTGAAAVPIFFNGRNSAVFQIAGLVHPKLRTALLARQVMNKRDGAIDVRIGSVIPARKLKGIEGDEALTAYLRQRTYVLRHRGAGEVAAAATATPRIMRPVVPIGDVAAMAKEIDSLPPEQRLVEADDNLVTVARAEQIPLLMREIGRLREITFRAAGEGSGKSLDLDQFDSHYLHLTVWNRAKREIVGSYRLGRSDQILAERGVAGLYTYELFDYRREMLERMGPALEVGRSFVRAEYQRSFTPLLLLWKGIGRFLVDHSWYRYLFGPVSISGAYQSVSMRLMVQFLQVHHGSALAAAHVAARTPFVAGPLRGWNDRDVSSLARDEDELSDVVADLEVDQKGVPVLIRQYLKLGAKFLSFNVDHSFGDCVDGLILVDLPNADRKMTERYLGREGLPKYLEYHRAAGALV